MGDVELEGTLKFAGTTAPLVVAILHQKQHRLSRVPPASHISSTSGAPSKLNQSNGGAFKKWPSSSK